MLTARLFGGLRVWVDGRPLPAMAGLRPRSLLAYLLLHPESHPRVRLAGRFWPDVLDTSARASLRSALWSVREALDAVGGAAYLRADRTHVGIAADLPREVDVERFELLASAGAEPGGLESAVALAGGPLLADLADEWVLDAQDRHRERLVDALERLAASAEARGDPAEAVRWTRAAIEQDRLRESAHRDLMRRLDACGERAQALAGYARLRGILAAEMGIAPSAATRELARSLREAGEPAPARPGPPQQTPGTAQGNGLVGRVVELTALAEVWRRATLGAGGVTVVEAPAGMGKSRLLEELGRRVRDGGGRLAVGAALDLDGAPPLAPWSEALRELVGAVAAAPDAAWPSDLARLCPAVETAWGRAAPGPSPTPDLERIRIFESVVEMISWSARDRPLLLGLEDLHRADPATSALLAHLGRRIGSVAALVVVTRRPAPENGELDAAIGAIRARGLVRLELRLEALGDADVGRIVREVAPGLAGDAAGGVVAAAEGNPLLAREAARAASIGRPPAEGLRASVRAPLERLPPAARELADLLAAAGRPLGLVEIGDLVAGGLVEALEAGAAAGLLAQTEDRRVRFTHDLLREACYAEIGSARRSRAHGRLAQALARRTGRRAAEVARHYRLADDPDAAQRYLVAAAQEARALGALDEAAAYLREAAELGGHDPVRVAEIWLALADVHSWRSDRQAMDAAFSHAETLLAAARDVGALALAHASRGRWLHTTLCYPAEALAASRHALELIDQAGVAAPEAYLLAVTGAAWAESVAGDPVEAQRLASVARGLTEGAGDHGLEAELEHVRGTALLRGGELARAGQVCEGAADLARRAGRPDAAALSLLTAATAAACSDDMARVIVLADRLEDWSWPGVSLELQMRAARAHALARLGRHEEAAAVAAESLRLAEGVGEGHDAARAELDLGMVLLAARSSPAAAARLRSALDAGAPGIPRALTRLHLAEALARCGDVEGAERELQRVPFEPVGAADMPETLVPRVAHVQGLVADLHGDERLARHRLDEAEAAWRRIAAATNAGEAYAAVLVDLGRAPVAGLVEPGREIAGVAADRDLLVATSGRR